MATMTDRIIELRKHLGLKQTQFAQKIGVTSQHVSMYEAGKARFSETTIRLICLTFGVNEAWLRDGVGEMMDDEALLTDQERRLLAFFRELSHRARIMLIEYAEKLVSDERALRGGAEVPKQAPEGAARPLEAPQEAEEGERRADMSKNPV